MFIKAGSIGLVGASRKDRKRADRTRLWMFLRPQTPRRATGRFHWIGDAVTRS
jgi:hypothetical protein